jgi:hypothetical protein
MDPAKRPQAQHHPYNGYLIGDQARGAHDARPDDVPNAHRKGESDAQAQLQTW